MKKIFFYSLLALCFTTACNAQNGKRNSMKQKTLIAYFSATGTTKAAAQRLASEHNAILWEIEPAEPYTAADLDWRDANSRSSREMKDPEERPTLKQCTDITPYDTIYVGFPIWWYTCPTIINTFMEAYDFQGKTVIPFATSGGSSIKKACADLKAAYPNLNWKEGKLLNRASKDELQKWVESVR